MQMERDLFKATLTVPEKNGAQRGALGLVFNTVIWGLQKVSPSD